MAPPGTVVALLPAKVRLAMLAWPAFVMVAWVIVKALGAPELSSLIRTEVPGVETTSRVRMGMLAKLPVMVYCPSMGLAQAPVQVCPVGAAVLLPSALTVPVVVLRTDMPKICSAWSRLAMLLL